MEEKMYCPNCGKELPDDARFCLVCGRALGGQAQVETAGDVEVCHIRRKWRTVLLTSWVKWEAYLEGKVIACSVEVRHPDLLQWVGNDKRWDRYERESADQNAVLVSKLMSDGWKPMSQDQEGQVAMMQREKR